MGEYPWTQGVNDFVALTLPILLHQRCTEQTPLPSKLLTLFTHSSISIHWLPSGLTSTGGPWHAYVTGLGQRPIIIFLKCLNDTEKTIEIINNTDSMAWKILEGYIWLSEPIISLMCWPPMSQVLCMSIDLFKHFQHEPNLKLFSSPGPSHWQSRGFGHRDMASAFPCFTPALYSNSKS